MNQPKSKSYCLPTTSNIGPIGKNLMLYFPMPRGKVCRTCGLWFPAAQLRKDKSRKDGLKPQCASCHKGACRAYDAKHREKRVEYQRQYRAEHADRVIASRRRGYLKHHDKRRAVARQRYWEDPEKMREKSRQARQRNPEYTQHHNRKYRIEKPHIRRAVEQSRRARKRGLPNDFTGQDWRNALTYFNGRCAYCGNPPGLLPGMRLSADHFIPLSSPQCPGTVPGNIIPACGLCNSSKFNRDAEQWAFERFGKRKARGTLKRIKEYFDNLK